MAQHLRNCLCLIVASLALVSCGNKGELFLPTDQQLADDLDVVNERINKSTETATDVDTETIKKLPEIPITNP